MKAAQKDSQLSLTIIGALVFALLVKIFCFDVMIAEGDSMAPLIPSGRVLLVNKLAYGFRFPWSSRYLLRWGSVQTGDIIVFSSPQGTLAVKRCVQIQEGHYIIVLGDNSAVSYDSRNYGPISTEHVIGRVEGLE